MVYLALAEVMLIAFLHIMKHLLIYETYMPHAETDNLVYYQGDFVIHLSSVKMPPVTMHWKQQLNRPVGERYKLGTENLINGW